MPRVIEPSRKVTEPVGVPVAGGTALTVAVNVIGWPKTDVLTEGVTVVVVFGKATLTVSVAAVVVAVPAVLVKTA